MGFELKALVVISTDCTGNCIYNYHTITTTTPKFEHHSIASGGYHSVRSLTVLVSILDK
jgi:hypothetical protein